MPEGISLDTAKELLNNGIAQAQELIQDPEKVDDLLAQVTEFVKTLPGEAGGALANIPLMVEMIKAYITQEYANVSPKVVATLVAALLYLVKKNDFISDKIPVLGLADDLAIIALAMKLDEAELAEFKAWKEGEAPQVEA